MVDEFLKGLKEPQHISKITEHIVQFKPNTYDRSVMGSLKLEDSGTFIFFKNYYIGLSRINYDVSRLETLNPKKEKKIRSWGGKLYIIFILDK